MAKDTDDGPGEGIGVLPLNEGKDGDEEVFVDDGTGGKGPGKGAGKGARDTDDDQSDELDGSGTDTGGEPLEGTDDGGGADEGEDEFRIPDRKRSREEREDAARRDDDDQDDFSARVRKRINREVRLKHEAQDRAREAEERAARAEMELSKVRGERELADIDDKILATKAKLKEARAQLDVDAEADLIAELTSLSARKARGAEAEAPSKPDVSRAEKERVDAWYARNEWMRDERMAWKKELALEANAALLRKGLKPSTDEFFERLDEEIAERSKGRRRQVERSPVDGGERGAGGGDDEAGKRAGARPTRVILTAQDKLDMRRYGLNPNDPAHLKSYAAEKAASGG